MDARIPKKSVFKFFLLSAITLGIYAIVFWHKLGKNVNSLCEGDGKRTMKYGFAFFLSVITFGVYGIIWKVKIAERLKVNAERYELMIPEGGTEVTAETVVDGSIITVYAHWKVAEPKAFAIYSDDDKSLTFYKAVATPSFLSANYTAKFVDAS